MAVTKSKMSCAPFYAVAVLWIAYDALFPLYAPGHFALLAALSLAVFLLVNAFTGTKVPADSAQSARAEEEKKPASAVSPEIEKMLRDGRLAIAEMKRLDENIADPGVSADIVRLSQVSQKIFEEVQRDPKKLPQIQQFMDYYLPTTLKLLNAYDRASAAGISGENVDATKARVEGMMRNVVAAFEKQLDALYGSEALDISTDITVLETMMAREGLTGQQLKADSVQKGDSGIQLEL